MRWKKTIVYLVTLVFIVGVVELGLSTEIKGTVTKIEGRKITVKDAQGGESTFEIREVPSGLHVGDSVRIKDGIVEPIKEGKPAEGC